MSIPSQALATATTSAPRAADYTIQGFLYQFNKTIASVLASQEGAEIVVEGVIEDIDIHDPLITTATQCKYHEGQAAFVLSLIYKPLLQMMSHFHGNSSANIRYHLFAYFPDREGGTLTLTEADIGQVFKSENKTLTKYIKELKGTIDVPSFLAKFDLEFGPKLDDLIKQIEKDLEACGFQADDIPTVIYPNALNTIANLSIKHDPVLRRITKPEIISFLQNVKTTAISRWTLALKNKAALLAARRKQLKEGLSRNVRRRYFLISADELPDFTDGVVVFISEYIERYHIKAVHTETPTFCFDCDESAFDDIRQRVFAKGIKFADGYIASRFDRNHFARSPMVSPARDRPEREFSVRLARFDTDREVLNMPKCHDLFLVSSKQYAELDLKDVNEERLAAENLRQVKYILGVTESYE